MAEFIDHGEYLKHFGVPYPIPAFTFDRGVSQGRISLSSINEFLDRIFSLQLDRLMSFFEEDSGGMVATKSLGLACVPETNREICEEQTCSKRDAALAPNLP